MIFFCYNFTIAMNPILLITIIGLGAWLILGKKQAIENLQFYIANVSASMDGFTPVITLNVAIQNASNEAFTINSIVGTLKSNGYSIGTVSSFASVPIAAAAESVYPVQVRLSAIGIAMDAYNQIIQHLGVSQTLTFDGTINAGGIIAPLNISYKVV